MKFGLKFKKPEINLGIDRKTLSVYGGLLCAIATVLAFVGFFSFLATWQQDDSLSVWDKSYFETTGIEAANKSGAFGFILGQRMIADGFGIGAIVMCIALAVLTARLFGQKPLRLGKLLFVTLLSTLTVSLCMALLGDISGITSIWEGGLGGGCGKYLVEAMTRMFGPIVTFTIVASMAFASLYSLVPWDKIRARMQTVGGVVAETDEDGEEEASENSEGLQAVEYEQMPAFGLGSDYEVVAEPPFEPEPDPAEVIYPADLGSDMDDDQQQTPADAPQHAPENGPDVVINSPEDELSTEIEEDLPRLDIRSDVDRYVFPSLDILKDYADKRYTIPREEIDRNIEKIKATLASFKIPIESISASVGYTVTLYKITLGDGVRVNTVRNLEDDIAIKIGIKSVRVVMLADAVGIEVPNDKASVVPLKAILNSDAFRNCKGELPIAVGYTITTKAKVFDLADAPHLLVAGATKQGKSVGLNAIISSLLYVKHPTELKFVFIDPKMVEFQQYSKLLKHYLALLPPLDGSDEADSAIVKDPKAAESVLRSLCVEMDERYKLFAAASVNKVVDYNNKYSNRFLRPDEGHHFMPYLVVVVDEYADLTKASSDKNLSRSIENSINRLAAKGRAAGLHVIIATQRPSVDVITGTIKGNFPTRMAFRTAQRQDSQTILGIPGAERLIGRGDMLFFTGADAERVQCALIDSDEIGDLTKYIASQTGYKQCCSQPYYLPDPGEGEGGAAGGGEQLVDMKNLDPMFEEAAKLAVVNQGLSTSALQRKMQLGFARAGRIMDQLESAGIVGPQMGSKPREALVSDLATLQGILDAFLK